MNVVRMLALTLIFSGHLKAADLCDDPTYSTIKELTSSVEEVVFPKHVDINLHYLYKHYVHKSDKCSANEVWVQGPVFTEDSFDSYGKKVPTTSMSAEKIGNAFCIPAAEFNKERRWAESVFETRVSSGSKNEGTSFLVGDNIVMTNHHIAAPGPDGKNCKHLEVSLNKEPQTWIKCNKVLFCDKARDVCFVEMKQPEIGKNISDFVPKMKLTCKPVRTQKSYVIGNSYKFGIQGSKGEVSSEVKGKFNHRIPTIGGSSGSPIINESGEVIGINYGHTAGSDFVSMKEDSYNYGTSNSYILNKVKADLKSSNNQAHKADLKKVLKAMAANPTCQ